MSHKPRVEHLQASSLGDTFVVPSMSPRCNGSNGKCEIYVPAASFAVPSEREKLLAAKMYGLDRGEEGWYYVSSETASRPGFIVVRRRPATNMLPNQPIPNRK